VMVGGYREVEVDFTDDNPGLTLFHRHRQLHMNCGLCPCSTVPKFSAAGNKQGADEYC
jgi:hypothetical protein